MPPRRTFLSSLAALAAMWLKGKSAFAESPIITRRSGARRVHPLCSLPDRDYQHGARSPSYVFRSQPALQMLSSTSVEEAISGLRLISQTMAQDIRLTDSDTRVVAQPELIDRFNATQRLIDRAKQPDVKLFQFARDSFNIAHCSISDISIRLDSSGQWLMSLRGDQNQLPAKAFEDNVETMADYVERSDVNRNHDIQIRRNAFKVQIRWLTSARATGENLTPSVENQPFIDQAGKQAVFQTELDEFWVQREAPYYILEEGSDGSLANYFQAIDQAEIEFYVRLDPLTGSGRGVVHPWQRVP